MKSPAPGGVDPRLSMTDDPVFDGGTHGSASPLTTEARRGGRLVGACALCVFIATAGGSLTSVDAVITYEVTKSLVSRGSVAFDHPGLNEHRGIDGRFYSPFGIGQSLYNVPFYVAARVLHRSLHLRIGKSDTIEKAGVALGSAVASAGTVWLVYLFAFRLTGDLNAALLTALGCGFGTLVWPYSKFGFNQALTAACLTGGLYTAWTALRTNRERLFIASGLWLAWTFLTRHEMALVAGTIALWAAFDAAKPDARTVRRLVYMGVPLAAALVFWLVYNTWRFGNPLDTGDLGLASVDDQRFVLGASTIFGVAGLLFSPGRSVFIYAPLVVVGLTSLGALAQRDKRLATLIGICLAEGLMLYGSLRYWDGLRAYGPRYLVPLIPLAILPLSTRWIRASPRVRRLVIAVTVVSGMFQLPGVLVDYSKVSVEHAKQVGNYSRDTKVLRFTESSLVLDIAAAAARIPENVANVVKGVRPAVPVPANDEDASFSQRFRVQSRLLVVVFVLPERRLRSVGNRVRSRAHRCGRAAHPTGPT
jgi:hypothetical protein